MDIFGVVNLGCERLGGQAGSDNRPQPRPLVTHGTSFEPEHLVI